MITSSLVVIAVICALFMASHWEARQELNRAQGASLVRALADVPFSRLVPQPGQTGAFQLLKSSVSNPDFAYAVVVDPQGRALVQERSLELAIPPAALSAEPASWIGDRRIELSDGRRVLEFHAPLLEDGAFAGQVRIGYLEPRLGGLGGKVSIMGALALPVFLLTCLANWWIRREVRPVTQASRQLEDVLDSDRLAELEIENVGGTGEFVERFNRFIHYAQGRLQQTEDEQKQLRTSSKILSYQKERSEWVLEALPDAALVFDDTGAVSFANQRLKTLLQIDPTMAVGKPPAEWCPQEDLLRFLRRTTGPDAARRSETHEFSPVGEPDRRLAVSVYPLSPERRGTLVTVRDVSAITMAHRAHGEFVNHVTHELKTPLNSIAMYAESLLDDSGRSDDFRIESCNVIQDEVHRLSDLLRALHTIARIETGTLVFNRQRVALSSFLRDASESVARSGVRKGVRLDLELTEELPPIYADKDLLRVALNNLLTNAVKYSHEGGRVVVMAEPSAETVSIHVRDEGIGIAEAELNSIFQKFYRSESVEARKRSGHGLGLSLAREIAEIQGGRIELQSVEGEGSTFTLVVPRGAGQTEASRE